jgi:integrase
VVAAWIRDAQAEGRSMKHELRGNGPAAVRTAEDRALVESLGDLVAVLRAAEAQKKAELYGKLAGVPAKVAQEILGHASVGITLDTYSHVVPAMREEAAATVAALIFPSTL